MTVPDTDQLLRSVTSLNIQTQGDTVICQIEDPYKTGCFFHKRRPLNPNIVQTNRITSKQQKPTLTITRYYPRTRYRHAHRQQAGTFTTKSGNKQRLSIRYIQTKHHKIRKTLTLVAPEIL